MEFSSSRSRDHNWKIPAQNGPNFGKHVTFINDHHSVYGVEPICRVLPIAPSTYREHAAKKADPQRLSDREKKVETLSAEVRRVFNENFGVYGVRKSWRKIKREDFEIARCTVSRLMKAIQYHTVINCQSVSYPARPFHNDVICN
ncbi:hypothetical protein FP2506_00495 [Fulvimarina pelagi HTCC2506]|uniref:HTH-like domain-containing protein n=1 Tax=Fulvimarina pelagi HTCC2506 TaxID=314231 RepID=Q0FXD4_9HYPH|nr:hypothetical protein FP2506_00495 [Fulvimarina pelagi HTCC2506]